MIAGAAAGAAAMFVPQSGALIMLAAATAFLNLRQGKSRLVAYVLGCTLAPAAAVAYRSRRRSTTSSGSPPRITHCNKGR